MRRVSKKPFEGEVIEGGAPLSTPLDARRGACYRVFAVADATVTDLDVVVRSSRGTPIAQDHGEDRWPIVQPDRPFCPLENDAMTIELTARHGKGRDGPPRRSGCCALHCLIDVRARCRY